MAPKGKSFTDVSWSAAPSERTTSVYFGCRYRLGFHDLRATQVIDDLMFGNDPKCGGVSCRASLPSEQRTARLVWRKLRSV